MIILYYLNIQLINQKRENMAAENTKIYMIVDTKGIQPGRVDDYVEFKDNRKNPTPKPDPVNFTSEIDAGEKVFWFGEAKDEASDTIEITGVTKKSSKDPDLIKDIGKDKSHPGVFKAQVVENYIKGSEGYSITFRIKGHKAEYEVDPKLEMVHPQ